jgi:hypothetical protein
MKSHQIEAWTLSLVDRVKAGQPNEDSRAELKRTWPQDTNKAARRIAGHANAAHGEPILWLIGVDQLTGVQGAPYQETSEWLAKVKSEFNGLMPRMTDVNVPVDGKTVVALFFETDRVPFVVKNPAHGKPDGGPVAWEVPWREGTSVRSATRDELLRLLSPLAQLPDVEILGASIRAVTERGNSIAWPLSIYLYITPMSDTPVVIPAHKCEIFAEMEGETFLEAPGWIAFGSNSALNSATRTELVVTSPGLFTLTGSFGTFPPLTPAAKVRIKGKLRPVRSDSAIPLDIELLGTTRQDSNYLAMWTYGRHDCW